MTKTWRVGVLALLVTGLAAGPVGAGSGGHAAGHEWSGSGEMFYLLFKGADLTPEQQGRVKEILSAHRTKGHELVTQLRAAQESVTDRLLAPGGMPADDLKPLTRKIAQLRDQLYQDRLAAALEVRGVLTQEQLAKVAKLKDRYRDLRAEMRTLFEGKP